MLNIDIGSGGCEILINSQDGTVVSRSLRVGGDALDEAIVAHLKRGYNLMIGERTAEEIKIQIGSAIRLEKELTMDVRARDLTTGAPKVVSVGSQEIREAFHEALSAILESIRLTMERCPPGFSTDLAEQGIVLAGGGARLRGLDRLVARETGFPVRIAEARKISL
jgi:rod shape-determining protein MreB